MTEVITQTNLPGIERISQGKVRDIYRVDEKLVLVATDRLSAFDVIFDQGIPHKGQVLTQLAAWWFHQTEGLVANHFLTANFTHFPEPLKKFDELRGRTTICKTAQVFPIECVVRGHLEGSAWKEYQAHGSISGIKLPNGLQRRSRLDAPIFTPATKAESGHDENISYEEMEKVVGEKWAAQCKSASLRLFEHARTLLESKNITIADTKFEFGMINGELILIDEILTPDSSRYWVKGETNDKGEPISFDKQYVRDYLETLDWDKTPPAPPLPDEVIQNTSMRYLEIYEKITGQPLQI